MKTLKTLTIATILSLGVSAQALNFELNSSTAGFLANPQNSFFQVDLPSTETGTAAGLALFDWTTGGSSSPSGSGLWIQFTWGANPQPYITGAGLKAGRNGLVWDADDFAAFNSSVGVYTGVRLYQDTLLNNPGNAFNGISHAGLDGRAGTTTKVPDAGTSVMLLGAGLLGIGALRRRLAK